MKQPRKHTFFWYASPLAPLFVFNDSLTFQSDAQIVKLLKLRENTTYNLTALIFSANGHIVTTPIQQMTTLYWFQKLDRIRHLSVGRVFKAASVVGVKVSWEPGFGN